MASYCVPNGGEVTDDWLDSYHYNLLRAESASDRLLGLCSVIYWGFYTFGDNYSRERVRRHLRGYDNCPGTTPEVAMQKTDAMTLSLQAGDTGTALAELSDVGQLGRTPFASKVVAFLAPSITGVYDNRIRNGLATERWTRHINSGIGMTSSSSVQRSYQSWCCYLSLIAGQLNLGISLGKNWTWSCGESGQKKWRAMDVERALFAKYQDPRS
jgi:hypothetical protein